LCGNGKFYYLLGIGGFGTQISKKLKKDEMPNKPVIHPIPEIDLRFL
jgi:hypothetical protein